jgi:hypothetical protein
VGFLFGLFQTQNLGKLVGIELLTLTELFLFLVGSLGSILYGGLAGLIQITLMGLISAHSIVNNGFILLVF